MYRDRLHCLLGPNSANVDSLTYFAADRLYRAHMLCDFYASLKLAASRLIILGYRLQSVPSLYSIVGFDTFQQFGTQRGGDLTRGWLWMSVCVCVCVSVCVHVCVNL